MIDTDVFGYRAEPDGKYTVLKNGDAYLSGLANAVEAAKVVDYLMYDNREESKCQQQ